MRFMRAVTALEPGDHACLVYDDDARRDAVLRQFVLEGLARGQRVLCCPPTETSAVDDLQADGLAQFDAHDVYTDAGTFSVDYALGRWRTTLDELVAEGVEGLRAAGGPPASVTTADNAHALTDYERRVTELITEHGVVAVCVYDVRTTDPRTLLGVVDAHPTVLYAVQGDPRLVVEVREPQSLDLRGSIETATIGTLVGPLMEAIADERDVELDLRDVDFIDLAGLRLLVEAAALLAGDERKLVLVGSPSWLSPILEMAELDTREGLVLQ